MFTEAAFGALTAAGTALLPYYLLLKPLMVSAAMGAGVGELIFALVFAAVPLAVSQTELALANGSHYYVSESWPASLSGLGAQAAVIGLFYLTRGLPDGGEAVLLLGTVLFVPIVEMVVINLTKTPRHKLPYGGYGLLELEPGKPLRAGLPVPTPLIGTTHAGPAVGVGLNLLAVRF